MSFSVKIARSVTTEHIKWYAVNYLPNIKEIWRVGEGGVGKGAKNDDENSMIIGPFLIFQRSFKYVISRKAASSVKH